MLSPIKIDNMKILKKHEVFEQIMILEKWLSSYYITQKVLTCYNDMHWLLF